jgi:hypothetical protein
MHDQEQRAVQVVRMGTLTLYEITADELRLIEAGDPSSIFLNFGLVSGSAGLGVGATMLAGGDIASRATYDTLVIITIIGLLAGVVLLVLWRRSAKQTRSVIQTVRERSRTQISTASLTVSGSAP